MLPFATIARWQHGDKNWEVSKTFGSGWPTS